MKSLPAQESVPHMMVYYDQHGKPRVEWGTLRIRRNIKGRVTTPQEVAEFEERLETQRQAEVAEYLETKRAASQRNALKHKRPAKRKKAA